jgi:peptide methionine sulfoxide reductase msrA/msrB
MVSAAVLINHCLKSVTAIKTDSIRIGGYKMINKIKSLPDTLLNIIIHKSTEPPFTGEYNKIEKDGTYLCRLCGLALFRSNTQFHSGCGWPSFDVEIQGAVDYKLDDDGRRTEICCRRCHAHLGHVFQGEGFTPKNKRYCVNSLSLDFVTDLTVFDSDEAIFAAGCFWGVEYYFKKLPGILKTEVGYIGGKTSHPTYEEVCNNNSGHYESIRIVYDPNKIDFITLAKYFFEIHDPTQINGQGPDIGEQYLSVAFYYNNDQKKILENLILILQRKNFAITTKILPVSLFWRAESYHQDYYSKTGKQPYCHHYHKRFD